MKKSALQLFVFLCLFVISVGAFQNPFTTDYLAYLKDEAQTVTQRDDPLYRTIVEKKNVYEEKPQNAKVDKVYKAIPGYNGLTVDVNASYQNMKEDGEFDPDQLVMEEVTPDVTLNDLPPAPIYKGHPSKEMVAFTINVAWGNDYIPTILKTFRQYDVKATFFLDGSWVTKNPTIAKMIADEGHEIGNHAYSHPNMATLSQRTMREELNKTNEVIQATLNKSPTLFAPPSGSYNDETVRIAENLDMKTILWTVDTIDWKTESSAMVASRVNQKIHPGAIVLMHPTASTSGGLRRMITTIRDKGYRISTVSNLLSTDRVTAEPKN